MIIIYIYIRVFCRGVNTVLCGYLLGKESNGRAKKVSSTRRSEGIRCIQRSMAADGKILFSGGGMGESYNVRINWGCVTCIRTKNEFNTKA